jgi:predicted CDP-diglyceride synthetase/phosphatidate cytidylyltransferase
MSVTIDRQLLLLVGGVLGVLVVASVAGAILQRRARSAAARATVANLNARVGAWWVMCALFALGSLDPHSRPRLRVAHARVMLAPDQLVDGDPTR